jgi:hypothetical protein
MSLSYTRHAEDRMREREISQRDCEAAVENDRNPWEQVLNGGNHKRYFHNEITVITTLRSDTVVTVWRGERGNW